jgi:hypothetical protein
VTNKRDQRGHEVAYYHYVEGASWAQLTKDAGYKSMAECRRAANLWLRELVEVYNLPISEAEIQAAEVEAMRPRLQSGEKARARRLLKQWRFGDW